MMSALRSTARLVAASLFFSGCDQPHLSADVATAPIDLKVVVIPEINGRTSVEFSWSAVPGITSYRLRIAAQRNGYSGDGVIIQAPNTSYTWTGFPLGTMYALLEARIATTEAASPETTVTAVDPRSMIDALFFGAGNLGFGDCNEGLMEGWHVGSQVPVRLTASLMPLNRAAVGSVVNQLALATAGNVTAVIGSPTDFDTRLIIGQVSVLAASPEEILSICGPFSGGCASKFVSSGEIQSARVVVPLADSTGSAAAAAHELGHAFGLCHIRNVDGFTPPPTMGPQVRPLTLSQLEPATIKAMQTVYAAGMAVGSPRSAFIQRGLIVPDATSSAYVLERSLSHHTATTLPPGWSLNRLTRDEYIVTKPLCLDTVAQR